MGREWGVAAKKLNEVVLIGFFENPTSSSELALDILSKCTVAAEGESTDTTSGVEVAIAEFVDE
jgi:hypothetical protein